MNTTLRALPMSPAEALESARIALGPRLARRIDADAAIDRLYPDSPEWVVRLSWPDGRAVEARLVWAGGLYARACWSEWCEDAPGNPRALYRLPRWGTDAGARYAATVAGALRLLAEGDAS